MFLPSHLFSRICCGSFYLVNRVAGKFNVSSFATDLSYVHFSDPLEEKLESVAVIKEAGYTLLSLLPPPQGLG